ncbi:hypothetical protein [Sinorhizobium meliloti]|uniref:hypothetical protein n=1 Tax=Rhizobium meliloti TaxID=382 RepID=UPI000FD8B877|nr:hypothetical protein [Sinorhizobium meliloti]RVQ17754.1 hypothetical protein CN067_20940 [Sinorhizobium meliloti]RVQ55715.1 hypothetical protein CN060_20925 [Sinorhizobium meliloti]
MTDAVGEETSAEGETFHSFRDRMVQKAIDEDWGILSYTVGELQNVPADYDLVGDPLSIANSTEQTVCKYQFIAP